VTVARITVDQNKMGGVPCIRDLRMPVATVVGMVADGMTVEEIIADRPRRPEAQATLLLAYLDRLVDALEEGAIVVIEQTRIRVRRLPIIPAGDDA
jgi:uncharacterized protein (DUF433 family)